METLLLRTMDHCHLDEAWRLPPPHVLGADPCSFPKDTNRDLLLQ